MTSWKMLFFAKQAIILPGNVTIHEMLQLFLVLLGSVGVLHRPFFFELLMMLMHCDDVRAYDLRCDLTDGGNGNWFIAYTDVRRTIVRQHSSCSESTVMTNWKIDLNFSKYDYETMSVEWVFYVMLWGFVPLFDRQIRSIPFRCSAIRASSQNDSLILKSHSGDISKHAILLRDAYSSACLAATWRLNAKCNRFPTNTFGTPGACYMFINWEYLNENCKSKFKNKKKRTSSTSFNHRSMPSKLHLFVMS